jgi:phenylalanine-4-hydroxylase
MALRRGGLEGIQKLMNSKNLGTIELNTGIQISGVFSEVIEDDGKPVYFKTSGPTALAFKNKEIIGHDKEYHSDGFGSPIGKLKGINLAIEDMSPTDLEAYGIYEGRNVALEFKGGISVEGEIITGKRNLQGKIILISFKNCWVKQGENILFQPDWGIYDMAVGAKVISAYAGVADPGSFGLMFESPKEKTHKIQYPEKEQKLHLLYREVRNIRDRNNLDKKSIVELENILTTLKVEYPNDWLLPLEIFELLFNNESPVKKQVLAHLKNLALKPEFKNLIESGLSLMK